MAAIAMVTVYPPHPMEGVGNTPHTQEEGLSSSTTGTLLQYIVSAEYCLWPIPLFTKYLMQALEKYKDSISKHVYCSSVLKGLHLHPPIARANGLAPTIKCTLKAGLFTGLWKQVVFLSNTVTRLKPIANSVI